MSMLIIRNSLTLISIVEFKEIDADIKDLITIM